MTPTRLVAAFEAAKGAAVLLAGSGLLALVHRDVHRLAEKLVEHAHLNPAARYPRIFLDAAAGLTDPKLLLLAIGAAAYAAVRLVEAYGLYRGRAWAEVLAAGSGAVYVPIEVFELIHRPSAFSAALLGVNLIVVAVMVRALRARRSKGTAEPR